MKKILVLCLLICCVSLTGCKNDKNEFDIGEKSNIEIIEKGVLLSIKEDTLTETGATLILKNESDVDVEYGNPYEIEMKKDGIWYKINVELNFNLPAFILKAKETKEINLNWEYGYGKLAAGEYRIIKDITIEKEDGTFDNFYISAEFTIK